MRLMRPDDGEWGEESRPLRLYTAAFSFMSMLTCRLENRRGLGDFESSVYTFSYICR